VLASTVPNLVSYDPAFAYELATIIKDGIKRMYVDGEDIFYYLTVENENYAMPPMPRGCEEGILRGMYKCGKSSLKKADGKAQLFGSGAILNEAIKAQEILDKDYNVAADVWSVTSYTELRRDGLEADRWNRLNPGKKQKVPYVTQCLEKEDGVFVAASDYMKALPDLIAPWSPKPIASLGTDGYGRSESREALRDFFEVDARFIVLATLSALAGDGTLPTTVLKKAIKKLGIDQAKPNPMTS
jgi:pyruvate dehydrogenase E1 component